MPSKRFLVTSASLFCLALAGMGLASAQSSSPFAPKKRAQAWEQAPAAAPAQYQAPQNWRVPAVQSPAPYQAPQPPSYQAPTYQALAAAPRPSYSAPAVPASADAPIATRPRPAAPMPSYSAQTPPKTFGGQGVTRALAGAAPQSAPLSRPVVNRAPAPVQRFAQAPDLGSPTPPSGQPSGQSIPPKGSPYAPRSSGRPQAWETPQAQQPQPPQGYTPQTYQAPTYQNPAYGSASPTPPQTPPAGYRAPNGYVPNGYQASSTPPTGAPYPGGPFSGAPQRPRSWTEKLGLKNIATLFRGKLTLGGAATYRDQPENQLGPDDGWDDSEIADAELEFEVSAITDGGLEYGLALGGRAQYDEFRRGFGGQLPECPPGSPACSGTAAGLRGHTSGFYNGGEDITKDAQAAIETAHLFLRSAYGDVTIGRDDGSAYLFSLGAPSLLAVGASNSPVDYTGYDSVKTVNDASGFAEKITYTSPRLLGDQIGVGVQFGVSYALDGDVCGVDYCNGKNIEGILQPEIEDIFEAGLALDRTFDNGLRAELTGTYARGSEQTGGAEFDDLESFGAGAELEYGKWTLGSSFLHSNNGLLDGDYTAYDVGLTWKPSALGFTLGYGHAEDDNVGLTSDQATFGITYDFDKFTLGTGVQYVDRTVNGVDNGLLVPLDQKAASIFVQGGFKF